MRVRRALPALLVAGACLTIPGALRAAPTSAATDSVESMYTRAGQFYAQQKYREAIPLFQRVVELDPRHGNAHALLGGAYLQLGDYPQAISAFERAIQLDEGIKLAYLGLVACNYLTDRFEAAQEWVSRLVPILTGPEREHYLTLIGNQFPLLSLPPGS